MTGRPSLYTEDLADLICARLADGESLNAMCKEPDMPSITTVFNWLNKFPAFVDNYTRAREIQADTIFDEILEISDDARNDYMMRLSDDEKAAYMLNGEHVQRSRLRVDARKWMAGKLRPKKYGDTLDVKNEHSLSNPLMEIYAQINGLTRSK